VKSSFSFSNGNCVDVSLTAHGDVMVRHSRQVVPILFFTREEWEAFLKGAKAREFEYEGLPVAPIPAGEVAHSGAAGELERLNAP